MSGVYIKGMEMPKNCWECHFGHGDSGVCVVDFKQHGDRNEPQNCPLVPVPPHGRLGDLDVQDVQIEALIERHLHGYTKSTWDFVCELRDILKRNPTIIPAEPAEEVQE